MSYFETQNLWLGQGGHGKVEFALRSRSHLNQLEKIDLLICAGAAGALDSCLNPGDVVASEATIEHDYKIRFVSCDLPKFPADDLAMSALKRVHPENFELEVGTIASGDEDIVSNERCQQIVGQTGAMAVAWEGAGGARACQSMSVGYLELRAITDHADKSAPQEFQKNLPVALENLVSVIVDFRNHY